MNLSKLNVTSTRRHKSEHRKLHIRDFYDTSYGQTKKQVEADYRHYVITGEIR